jgi:hypothetical protein
LTLLTCVPNFIAFFIGSALPRHITRPLKYRQSGWLCTRWSEIAQSLNFCKVWVLIAEFRCPILIVDNLYMNKYSINHNITIVIIIL